MRNRNCRMKCLFSNQVFRYQKNILPLGVKKGCDMSKGKSTLVFPRTYPKRAYQVNRRRFVPTIATFLDPGAPGGPALVCHAPVEGNLPHVRTNEDYLLAGYLYTNLEPSFALRQGFLGFILHRKTVGCLEDIEYGNKTAICAFLYLLCQFLNVSCFSSAIKNIARNLCFVIENLCISLFSNRKFQLSCDVIEIYVIFFPTENI